MGYKFSPSSLKKLSECDSKLQDLFNEVLKTTDCIIVCGHRNQEDQDRAFQKGFSKVEFPNSKHNSLPSMAVDVMPYPLDWNARDRMVEFSKVVFEYANHLGIKVRWGGDFNGDGNLKNDPFVDMPHWELVD